MFRNRTLILICIGVAAMLGSSALYYSINSEKNMSDGCLLKPSGPYGVGYQDMEVVNRNFCPDKFYQPGVNEADFSSTNPQHCHVIVLRIYYPSVNSVTNGDQYYLPVLTEENKWLISNFKLTTAESKLLNTKENIRTYAKKFAQLIRNSKFPIIVYMPGSGQSTHTYNNIISNLVSHGYVVVGINSTFANGPLQLSNGHVIKSPGSYNDDGRLENLSDLKLIIDQLPSLAYQPNLGNNIDFTKIGLLGHSMGAMNIMYLLSSMNNTNIKGAALMDPGNVLKDNYPVKHTTIPTLVLWSAWFKNAMHASITLAKNIYSVELRDRTTTNKFSNHENFSDLSTLQYHPAYQIPKIYVGLTNSDYMGVGYGDGNAIAIDINAYLLAFFDRHLKNRTSQIFDQCASLSANSQIVCGQ